MKNIVVALVLFFVWLGLPVTSFGEDLQKIENTYVVNGILIKLPLEPRAGAELLIKHEAIPNYVDQDGKVVGMEAMTMPFYLGEGVDLKGLVAGDKVEFTLLSQWKPKVSEVVTAIKKK